MTAAIAAPRRIWAVHTVSMYGATSSRWRLSERGDVAHLVEDRVVGGLDVAQEIAVVTRFAPDGIAGGVLTALHPRGHAVIRVVVLGDQAEIVRLAAGDLVAVGPPVDAHARERVVVGAERDELVHELRVRATALLLGRQVD